MPGVAAFIFFFSLVFMSLIGGIVFSRSWCTFASEKKIEFYFIWFSFDQKYHWQWNEWSERESERAHYQCTPSVKTNENNVTFKIRQQKKMRKLNENKLLNLNDCKCSLTHSQRQWQKQRAIKKTKGNSVNIRQNTQVIWQQKRIKWVKRPENKSKKWRKKKMPKNHTGKKSGGLITLGCTRFGYSILYTYIFVVCTCMAIIFNA